MNIRWSERILEHLHQEGVREIVFCAGARNSPLVAVLAKSVGFGLHSFFEERSAAFFALGVARRTGRPVAIVTTSGTASAELLPAVIEAYHTGVPLICITADRPRRLRGTGAPQAIDQTGLFAKFVAIEHDLENGELFALTEWNRRAPVHLNICFDEPLIDETIESVDLVFDAEAGAGLDDRQQNHFAGRSSFATSAGSEWAALRLSKFLRNEGALVIIVGTLETEAEREEVSRFLRTLGAPVYLEGTSGLREKAELQELSLRSGDKVLAWGLKRELFTRVLRIGGIPTVRIWRDLEEPSSSIEVLSLTALPFAGLSRGEAVCAEIAPALRELAWNETSYFAADPRIAKLYEKDREVEGELLRLFENEPLAEPSMMNSLSKLMADQALVYIGNSLPIREWDLAADRSRVVAVEANRGVNGIDGQVSTFLGLAAPGPGKENWAVIGDLTALYDLTGPWALGCRESVPVRLVVINNGGGKIFSRIFRNSLFENRHGLGFEHWAKMWNLSYHRWTELPQSFVGSETELIEIIPDDEATRRFWDHYDSLWT